MIAAFLRWWRRPKLTVALSGECWNGLQHGIRRAFRTQSGLACRVSCDLPILFLNEDGSTTQPGWKWRPVGGFTDAELSGLTTSLSPGKADHERSE